MTTSIFCYGAMRKNSTYLIEFSILAWMVVILILYILPAHVQTQELMGSAEPEKIFQKAVESYRQADYYRALIGFRGLLRDYPEYSRTTAALLMQAKCYFWLQNYDQAIASLETLLENFPHSTYLDDAHYLLGICLYHQGHHWRSADQFREVIEEANVAELAELARDNLRVLVTEQLSLPQLKTLYDELPNDDISPWILLEIARRELVADHREESLTIAEQVLRLFPDSEVTEEAESIRRTAQEKPPQHMTLGVVCPLSGTYASYGEELYDGVQMAVQEYNSISDKEIRLEAKDSQGSAVRAIQVSRELIDEDHVMAIIGPLLSTDAVGVGALCECRGIPMITPTAAEEEIAQVGRFVFQRSLGPRTLGEKMAAYAVEELELQLFAVLAPRDSYGQAAVEGFSKAALEKGARILIVTWYQTGITDFKEQLLQIRHRKQVYDDSLKALGVLPQINNPAEPDTLPPEERRVLIDGIFVPAYPSEAGMIAPQIAFHRLETLICGTSSWGSRDALRIGGQYLDGVYFATDFVEEFADQTYQKFVADYMDRYDQRPGKVAIFSYECARLVLQGIEGGAHTAEGLYQFLSHTEGYQGLAGTISFSRGQGANDEVMILTIQENRVLRLE